MTKRIVILMMSVGLCASMTQAAITAIGDVKPADPATWTTSTSAIIGEWGTGSVTIDDDSDVVSIVGQLGKESGSSGSVTVSGAGSTWTNSALLYVGLGGDGTLEITGGGVVSNEDSRIAYQSGSTGAVTVSGGGSRWTHSGELSVGFVGDGTLEITDGGTVGSTGGCIGYGFTGAVTVSGADSTWTNSDRLDVGLYGDGTLEITDGGKVSNIDGFIARAAGSTGAVNVQALDSSWTNSGSLYVGGSSSLPGGTGELNVTNGSVTVTDTLKLWPGGALNLSGGHVTTGSFDNSSGGVLGFARGTLTVDGGTLSPPAGDYILDGAAVPILDVINGATGGFSGDLIVAYNMGGALNINSGGAVVNERANIGEIFGSLGSVAVDNGTWTCNSYLTIGKEGSGVLEITNGSVVNNQYAGHIGFGEFATGLVTVDDATWNSESLYVGTSGEGALEITNGGVVNSNTSKIGCNSTSIGTATVDGGTWNNSWFLDVSTNGDGTLSIINGGRVNSSSGRIGFGGTGDVTVNDGTWTNDGELIVGYQGVATLSIANGGEVGNTDGSIAEAGGSIGIATVRDAGSVWTNTGGLYIGGSAYSAGGTGELTVSNGGTVNVGGAMKLWYGGTLNIIGGTIRFAEPAPLTENSGILNYYGGRVEFDCDVAISASIGISDVPVFFGWAPDIPTAKHLSISGQAMLLTPVTLSGGTFSAGSLVNAAFLQFDSGAFNLTDANLSISLGGLFGRTLEVTSEQSIGVTNDATVGPTGLLLINGGTFSAATTTNQGEIYLSTPFSGSLGLLAGSAVNNEGLLSGDGRISAELNNTATGQVEVAFGGQLMLTGAANVNHGTIINSGGTLRATGSVSNEPGGNISTDGHATLSLTGGLDNSGTVAFSDADAYLYGDVTNNGGALVGLADASTTRFVGAFVNNGDVYVGSDSRAIFLGPVSGAGDFPGGGTIEFVDGFSPGSSPAAVSFGGNVVFADGALLAVELGGTVEGDEHDSLDVAGDLTPGGALQVVLIDDFAPDVGDTFDIFDWGTLTGATFDEVELPELVGRKVWDISELYSEGEISVIGMLDGDTDVDWDVDSVDLANLTAVFGEAGDWHTDFNGDGRIDLIDFSLMRANFGAGVGSSPGGAPEAVTPEPATMIFLIGGVPLLLRLRRRRNV